MEILEPIVPYLIKFLFIIRYLKKIIIIKIRNVFKKDEKNHREFYLERKSA